MSRYDIEMHSNVFMEGVANGDQQEAHSGVKRAQGSHGSGSSP
jgi:hypothetical protein